VPLPRAKKTGPMCSDSLAPESVPTVPLNGYSERPINRLSRLGLREQRRIKKADARFASLSRTIWKRMAVTAAYRVGVGCLQGSAERSS
jgi:hypothetical protein